MPELIGFYGTKELISERIKAQYSIILQHNVLAKEVCVTMSRYSISLLF